MHLYSKLFLTLPDYTNTAQAVMTDIRLTERQSQR